MLKEFGFVKEMVWSCYTCWRGRLTDYYVHTSVLVQTKCLVACSTYNS